MVEPRLFPTSGSNSGLWVPQSGDFHRRLRPIDALLSDAITQETARAKRTPPAELRGRLRDDKGLAALRELFEGFSKDPNLRRALTACAFTLTFVSNSLPDRLDVELARYLRTVEVPVGASVRRYAPDQLGTEAFRLLQHSVTVERRGGVIRVIGEPQPDTERQTEKL